MKNFTWFALLLCFFAVLGISSSQIFKKIRFKANHPINRALTKAEIKNLLPKIDSKPVGQTSQPSLSGKIVTRQPIIVDGKPAVPNMHPWMVALVFESTWFCGGSLISSNWVLTSGSCLFQARKVRMFMGSTNWKSATRTSYTSTFLTLHPTYNDIKLTNDIGLIRIPTPIKVTVISAGRIVPIRLPSMKQASYTFDKKLVTVSNWGQTNNKGVIVNSLNSVSMNVISNAACADMYGIDEILHSNLCTSAGTHNYLTNICSGDSGSPLQITEKDGVVTQIGIVSFNDVTSCFAAPAGFTRVTSYLGWISKTTGLAIRH